MEVCSDRPTATPTDSCDPSPFHFPAVEVLELWFLGFGLLWLWRFLVRQRVLYLTACFSKCSRASLTAEGMSPAWASPTSGPLRGLMVISALWRCFSTARTTLVSNLLPTILRILVRPDSTSLRMAGVTSQCLPVYSTFMSAPP